MGEFDEVIKNRKGKWVAANCHRCRNRLTIFELLHGVKLDKQTCKRCMKELETLRRELYRNVIANRVQSLIIATKSKKIMSQNKIQDLREVLFETLKGVKDGTIDFEKADCIVRIGQSIINSAKVEVDFIKAVKADGGSGFIPLQNKEEPCQNG